MNTQKEDSLLVKLTFAAFNLALVAAILTAGYQLLFVIPPMPHF